MLQESEERRQAPRHGIARVAKIMLSKGAAPLYCVVTDISDGGVRVHANGFHVPDEFVLLLEGDGPLDNGTYRVIWRRDDEVGAKLVRVT
jgi:PilZ domain